MEVITFGIDKIFHLFKFNGLGAKKWSWPAGKPKTILFQILLLSCRAMISLNNDQTYSMRVIKMVIPNGKV